MRYDGSRAAFFAPNYIGAITVSDFGAPVPGAIRVLIADSHAAVRRALAMSIEAYDDLHLAGTVATGEEAIRVCECAPPDVILLDVTLPDMTGAAAIRAIHEMCPQVSIIALSTFQEERLSGEALKAGAVNFLLKNISADQLACAIRAACADQPRLQPDLPANRE
jgi:DNA-binding NarL/FixJ family response regulator